MTLRVRVHSFHLTRPQPHARSTSTKSQPLIQRRKIKMLCTRGITRAIRPVTSLPLKTLFKTLPARYNTYPKRYPLKRCIHLTTNPYFLGHLHLSLLFGHRYSLLSAPLAWLYRQTPRPSRQQLPPSLRA
jgi:hypothetical protein